jgi:hypothetical protein
MLLHTENVDNVDNFVNNSRLSKFSSPPNVDNFVVMWGEMLDNFPVRPPVFGFFVHSAI